MSIIQFTDTGDPLNSKTKRELIYIQRLGTPGLLSEILISQKYEWLYSWSSGVARVLTNHNHIHISSFFNECHKKLRSLF